MEFIIALAGLLLWLASSVVLANFDANNSLPKSDRRTIVVILAWVNTLLFIILTTVASTSVSPRDLVNRVGQCVCPALEKAGLPRGVSPGPAPLSTPKR